MKHLFYYIFLICILVASCKNEKRDTISNVTSVIEDTVSFEQKEDTEPLIRRPDVIYSENIVVDTVINKFHISFVIKNNSSVIYYRSIDGNGDSVKYNYADKSVFLTLKYNNKVLIANKEYNKYSFSSYIPDDVIETYQLYSCWIQEITSFKTVFYFNICMPDTDVCYLMGLTVDNNGTIGVREEEQYMESDSIF